MDKIAKQVVLLHSVVSDWPTHFADAFNKYMIQKYAVESIERTQNLTIDNKIKEALTLQLTKEKAVELQLSQQEKEWQMEGHKAQLETD
jgi:hypothetical protein